MPIAAGPSAQQRRGPASRRPIKAGMSAHLAGCPACAEEYRSLRELLTEERS